MVKVLLIIAFILSCNEVIACPNSYSYGGSVKLMRPKNSSIRMLREWVKADLFDDKEKITCKFVFKNEGKETDIWMGFPIHTYFDYIEEDDPCIPTLFYKSWVDGKPVKLRCVKPKQIDSENSQGWNIRKIHFDAGQIRTIVDTHESYINSNQAGTAKWFRFIQQTASSWKGRIDKAVIVVDTSHMHPSFVVWKCKPAGYKQVEKKYIWKLYNIEPSEDIDVSLTSSMLINDAPIIGYFGSVKQGHVFVFASELRNLITGFDSAIWNNNTKKCKIVLKRKFYSKAKRTSDTVILSIVVSPLSRKAIVNGHRVVYLKQAPYFENNGYLLVPLNSLMHVLGGKAIYYKDKMYVEAYFPNQRKQETEQGICMLRELK